MPDLSNNSFIPKRGPATHRRSVASRQVYVFTLISYSLMFATLLAVGGVFFYTKHIENARDEAIVQLNQDINSFDESLMDEIIKFDRRLQQATDRLDNTASLAAVFNVLEAVTIGSVEIKSFSLERELDNKFMLQALIKTDSFDSTLFQRDIYSTNDSISSIIVKDLDTSAIEGVRFEDVSGVQAALFVDTEDGKPFVSFEAEIEIPLAQVLYSEREQQSGGQPTFDARSQSELESITIDDVVDTTIQSDAVQVNTLEI